MPRTAATGRIMPRYQGGSVLMNGTNSTIPTTLTSNDVFKTGNGFSVWAWVKVRGLGGSSVGRIYDKSDSATLLNGFFLNTRANNTFRFGIATGVSVDSANNAFVFNRWTLALVTVASNGTVTHYVNGVQSGTPATTGSLANINHANPFTIGNRADGTDRPFDGLMGEGGICPRVLTQAEITALYEQGTIPTGTAHHWKLDEVIGVFVDSIGGATGTGSNTAYSPDVPVQQRVAATGRTAATGRVAI